MLFQFFPLYTYVIFFLKLSIKDAVKAFNDFKNKQQKCMK